MIDALNAVITEAEEYIATVRGICHLKRDEKEANGIMKPSSPFTEASPSKQSKSSPKKSKKESTEWSLQDIVQPDLPSNPDLAKVFSCIVVLCLTPIAAGTTIHFVELN